MSYLIRMNKFQICITLQLYSITTLFHMNRRSARQMLTFLINNPRRQSQEQSRTYQKQSVREIPILNRNQSKGKSSRKYYQHRIRPVEPIQPSIEVEGSVQVAQHSETSNQKINNLPSARLSHRIFLPNNTALAQYDTNHSSQQRISKKRHELTPYRYSKMNSPVPQKEDNHYQMTQTSRSKGFVMKKIIKGGNSENINGGKMLLQEIKGVYYIADVKKSVQQFMKDREYTDQYLNHFLDSLSVFQSFAYATIPKENKCIELPSSKEGKITLIFDLDETLIHTQVMNQNDSNRDMGWGKTVQINTDNGEYRINLKVRPHAVQVLKRLKQKYEIGIFTASQQHYGSKIIQELDPQRNIFSFKLFRQHCFQMHSRTNHVKDLRILKNRDLSKIILVDNCPATYLFQKNNAIPIVSFFDDQSDTELIKLQTFLEKLVSVKDVRVLLKDYFKLDQYHQYNNMLRLIRELYS